MSVLYFLLLVGVLVVIHELGHFVAAKLLDVEVQRFSLGYGRPLVRFKARETEYQIAIFPIGGYVRILGIEGDAKDGGRSFASRPLWQRVVIVLAGPAANLLLPVVIYFAFYAGNTMLPAAVVGDVIDGSVATHDNMFQPGDRILEIDGRAMRYWEDVENAIQHSPGKELRVRIQRNGKTAEHWVTPIPEVVRNRDGRVSTQGRIGITSAPYVPIVGVIDAQSPAARAGLRTGDLVVSIDGQPVRNWTDLQRRLGKIARRASIVYFRGTELPDGVPQLQLLAPGFADLVPDTQVDAKLARQSYTGLEHAEMFVARVDPGSPAAFAGLRRGDLIVALDDKPVVHWMDLDQRLQAEPQKAFKLTWKRSTPAGKIEVLTADLTQVRVHQLDDYGHDVSILAFGASHDVNRGRAAMVPIDGRFGYALSKALSRTGETISTMVGGFVQIIGGDKPSDALGGPLMMYRVASVSGDQGWSSFFLMLALISINLGLINLLPIPMLDGGHLLVFAVEGARGRALSAKTRERIQLAGIVLLAVITILALRNDVMRYLWP
jgi:regulator of sigma E protease